MYKTHRRAVRNLGLTVTAGPVTVAPSSTAFDDSVLDDGLDRALDYLNFDALPFSEEGDLGLLSDLKVEPTGNP